MAGNSRIMKRSINACTRCRSQKIKCTGLRPCENCNKRRQACIFDDRDRKILVTKGYLEELEQKLASLQQNDRLGPISISPESVDSSSGTQNDAPEVTRPPQEELSDPHIQHELEDPDSSLTNPLSSGPPAFMSAGNGRTFYLGTSSDWSFTRRILSLTHGHVYQEPLPTEALLFDGATYDLEWDGKASSHSTESPVIPTFDHAIYLINTVKFRCGQLYHLFDEEDFMHNFNALYSQPAPNPPSGLWYIHFLIILAFGKGFVQQKPRGRRPPGAAYFVKALQLLPDIIVLHQEPIESTEILCCISLYLQAVDYRSHAHNYIGQAMRMAMAKGMHTQIPTEYLGEKMVQRCRKVWWTVYILDREMTSLMGLPQSLSDEYVDTLLPTFSGSVHRAAGIEMHIKLCRIIAEINSTVYAFDGRLNRNFLRCTKSALETLASLADELQDTLPLQLDQAGSGTSRPSACLHLLYHGCIVLATRPLLFCFLKIRLESPANYLDALKTSRNGGDLIQICMDSSHKIIGILNSLQFEGLLETFLPFDLDSIFVSTVVLLIGPTIDPRWTYPSWLDKAYAIFEDMIESRNLIAIFRRSELQYLEELLSCVPPVFQNTNPPQMSLVGYPTGYTLDHSMMSEPSMGVPIQDEGSCISEMRAAQIMAVADSIESIDTEWISNAIIEHGIW